MRIVGVTPPSPPRPARYQRSTGGLLGAMVVTLGLVVGVVVLRSINRDELSVEPDRVDYLATVRSLQDSGEQPVYPRSLPDGWTATSVRVEPGPGFSWRVGILTDDERFVGVADSVRSARDLVAEHVDENARTDSPVRIDGALAEVWAAYSDSGGDHALAAQVGDRTVLVYGSASVADLQAVVRSLTQDPLPAASSGAG